MADIPAINAHLQYRLESEGMAEVPAVKAAKWLGKAGLLPDSPTKPGKPLRDLLRAGHIEHAQQRPPQRHGRWFIRRHPPQP